MKGKPHLALSFLDTVMIIHYVCGLPATEILPYRVQSISHRESLSNLNMHSTSCLCLIQSSPGPAASLREPQHSSLGSASHLSALSISSVPQEHPLSPAGITLCLKKGTVSKIWRDSTLWVLTLC